MADLGLINAVVANNGQPALSVPLNVLNRDAAIRRVFPLWAADAMNADVSGVITGVVQVQGVPTANIRVTLHHRRSGLMIAGALTDKAGAYSFANLDKTSADYFVIALTEQPYNAMIYDKITPQ